MPNRKRKETVRKIDPEKERKLKTLAKIVKIVGYAGAAAFTAFAIYWFTIPGGWLVGVCFLIPSIIIAIETRRVIKA